MLANDVAGEILAQFLFRDALLGKDRLELVLVESAGHVLERRYAGDFGIDQLLAARECRACRHRR